MKRLLLVVITTMCISSLKSQAVTIIMKDSTTHVGYVMKEDSSRIKFSSEDFPTVKWINKVEILNYSSIGRKLEQTQIPIDTSTGKVSYTEIVYADSVSKKGLFDRAVEWVALNYKSANDVIQLKNEETGKIIAKGLFSEYLSLMGGLTVFDCSIYHTITIDTKEGRVRMQITDLYEKHYAPATQYSSGRWVETPIEDEINPEYFARAYKDFISRVDKNIHSTLDSFLKYIQKPSDKKLDDW